jgi:hypothetical protein
MLTTMKAESITRLRSEESEFVSKFAPFVSGKNIAALNALFNEGLNRIERNANASLLFTDLSLRISALLKNT